MAFQIQCPCGNILEVPDILAGQTARCRSCGTLLHVPREGEAATSTEEAAAPQATEERPAVEAPVGLVPPRTPGHVGRWLLFVSVAAILATATVLALAFLRPVIRDSGPGSVSLFDLDKQYRLVLPEAGSETPEAAATTTASSAGPPGPALALDLQSGLLNGLGVGSHLQHIKPLHSRMSYLRVGDTLRQPDTGVQLDLRGERIARVTLFVQARERDGSFFKAFPGVITPALTRLTSRQEAVRLLGPPFEERTSFIAYRTRRDEIVRVEFTDDGFVETLVLEESPELVRHAAVHDSVPARYPEAVEPYRLPESKGEANFDLGRQVCLGLPLGVPSSALVDLPESMKADKQGGRATYPPTGLIVWFADQKITQMAVFVRPEYSRTDLKPFRGTFSHGISRHLSLEALRQKLGPENGYSENYRVRILHYILADRYFQFGFTPDGQKLVFAGMGLITRSDQDLLPAPQRGTLRSLREGSALWRGSHLLATAEAGTLFPWVSETRNFYGVQCKPEGQTAYAWISKNDARDTASASVWVEVQGRARYLDDPAAGEKRLLDGVFLSTNKHFVTAGTITRSAEVGPARTQCLEKLYSIGQTLPVRSTRIDPVSELRPLPAEGQYFCLSNTESSLVCVLRSYRSSYPGMKFKAQHDRGSPYHCLRLSEDGKTLAAAWRDGVDLFEALSGRKLKSVTAPEPLLDAALSRDGRDLWTLHENQVFHWNLSVDTRRLLPISGRHLLLAVRGGGLALAISRSRQVPTVTAFQFPAGVELWRSDDLFPLPPFLGESDESGQHLAAPSLRHRLACAIADLATGRTLRQIEIRSEETESLSVSDLRTLRLSPDGRHLLAGFRNGLVLLLNSETGKIVSSHTEFLARPDPASCTPGGELLAVGRDDLQLFDARAKLALRTFEPVPQPITAVEIDPGRKWLAAGDLLGQTRVWDLASGDLLQAFSETPPLGPITKLRFASDGQAILVSARNHSALLLYEIAAPFSRQPLPQGEAVHHFEVSSDGRRALSLGVGGRTRIYLWDLVKKELQQSIVFPQASRSGTIVFGSDGGKGLMLLDGQFYEWPLGQKRGGMNVVSLADNYQPGPCLLSPDGIHVFRFEGENARIWDVPSRRAIGYADDLGLDPNCRFSSDGRCMVRAMEGQATLLRVVRLGSGAEFKP
ncbi:MAG: WD40 repeat domain-containing protein [Planctomycetes bacterium]|nr:WD40 repeat domain-containing protein [Planctomycetota bacterium]